MSGLLSAADLAMMRAALTGEDALLPTQDIIVKRLTETGDGTGGRTQSWATVDTYQGRLRQARGQREPVAGDRTQAQAEWEAVLPYDADVKPEDRLSAGGAIYEVVGTDKGRTDALEMVCKCIRRD